ncbi:MAG: Fic family protein [Acidimicrobiales bacterium]
MADGKTVTITWQGRRVEAFVPAPLKGVRVELPERIVRATEQAAASLLRADDRVAHRFEPLARLMLRAEGVASSYIEGVRAPAELVAVAEVDAGVVDATSAWVADNLAVVDASLEHARSDAVLTTDDLHRWHVRLMAHGALPDELVGAFRQVQNWVGGATPREAAYVPPPPEHVDRLMRDLLRFTNTSRVDPVTAAAIVHAQFETIHPYGDGNGRLGRVLIGWVLARRVGVAVPPPVSVVIARDSGGYLSGLTRWRRGDVAGWIGWIAESISRSAEQVVDLIAYVDDLARRWEALVADVRADATAHRLLELVPRHLVVTAPMVADLLGVSAPTARDAIATLAARGILEPLDLRPVKPGRPVQWWMAGELLSVVSRWSR